MQPKERRCKSDDLAQTDLPPQAALAPGQLQGSWLAHLQRDIPERPAMMPLYMRLTWPLIAAGWAWAIWCVIGNPIQ